MASSGYNAFLKRSISNNKILSQIGFMNNDDEIYLNNQESYESNKQTLVDLFGDNCTESSNTLTCKTTDYMILLDNTEENNLSIYLENYKGNNRLSCSSINNSSECFEITTDTLMLVRSNSTDVFGKNIAKNDIESIEIVDNKNIPADAIDSWDVGTLQNGSIIAWYKDEDSNNKYELYIGQDGGVVANPISDDAFSGYEYTKNIDVSKLDVSNVRSMKYMFNGAGYYAPTFNIDGLDNWNTSNVTNMSSMFSYVGYNATTFTIEGLDNWDTSKVTDMSYMFSVAGYNATTFDISYISNWDTSQVTNMSKMFYLAGYYATTWNIGDLSAWDTSKVTNMSYMFGGAGYNATIFTIEGLDDWDTSNVTNMSDMFYSAGYNATTFDISYIPNWNTSKVTNMSEMFSQAGHSATTFDIGDLSNWDTSKVTNMSYMFGGAGYNATTFDISFISNWDTSKVTDMYGMFYNAGYNATTWNIGDLSNWDTSNVTNMSDMFYSAGYNATTWNSIGNLKIYANGISGIFYNCPKAKATLNIYSNPSSNYEAFKYAATGAGSGITVNYSSSTTNIDNIIATKSSNSNVVKGNLLD